MAPTGWSAARRGRERERERTVAVVGNWQAALPCLRQLAAHNHRGEVLMVVVVAVLGDDGPLLLPPAK